MKVTEDKLLSIAKAAKILGVHPLTLRNWTDQGYIAYYKTPGGHRRFKKRDLEQFLAKMNQGGAETNLTAVAQQAVHAAITAAPRRTETEPVINQLELSEPSRETMRLVGQQLLGITIQYVAGNADEAVLQKGREIGQTYGQFAYTHGLSTSEIVSAFNFFRDTIIEATFAASGDSLDIDTSNPQLYRRLNRFFNGVLLATIQAAEAGAAAAG